MIFFFFFLKFRNFPPTNIFTAEVFPNMLVFKTGGISFTAR